MRNLTEYLYPTDIKDALSMFSNDITSSYLAGGTHLVGDRNNKQRFIDLGELGLNEIVDKGSKIEIGATATISEAYHSPIIAKIGDGILKKACRLIGDTPLRNMITFGGNIAKLYPWAGLPTVLLTLDARIEIVNKTGEHNEITAEQYFFNGGVNGGDIITKISIPKASDWIHFYEKFALTTVDYTWLTMAFSVKVVEGVVEDSRLAVSRITKVRRIKEVENLIIGKNIIELNVDELMVALQSSIDIISDFRSSKEYRKHLLGVLFQRMLLKLQEGNK
ncbi:MAG: FAD binding domain-containing protein [Candidatus Hodarchaeales archaeon]|jgi:CO/xanthine dehydrogenase FAD-binding subunit